MEDSTDVEHSKTDEIMERQNGLHQMHKEVKNTASFYNLIGKEPTQLRRQSLVSGTVEENDNHISQLTHEQKKVRMCVSWFPSSSVYTVRELNFSIIVVY